MCLAQGHKAVKPVRLKPAAPWSSVKHSTTEPLRSPQPKHMLWVLKRTSSMRRFIEHPKHMLKLMGKKIHIFFTQTFFVYLNLWTPLKTISLDITVC